MHDWVGDLSLNAKWMTKMNTENTIHCLLPEMPALFHVELPDYRHNPFDAAPRFKLCSPCPIINLNFVKIVVSYKGLFCPWQVADEAGWQGGAMPLAESNLSSVCRVFTVWYKSTQNQVFSSPVVTSYVGRAEEFF